MDHHHNADSFLMLYQDLQLDLNADIALGGSDVTGERHRKLPLEQLFGEGGDDIPAHRGGVSAFGSEG